MSFEPRRIADSRPRRSFIGGSEARIIMGDDEATLVRLWQEKRGDVEPEDLSGDLLVQLGSVTEPLNRHWYEKNTTVRMNSPRLGLKAGNSVRFAKFRPNATLAHRIYFERLPRFASRTPAPPPFSGINSTPAFWRAFSIATIVRSCAANSPGCVSSRFTLGRDTPEASAKSFCSHRKSILAARTCSLVSDNLIPGVLTSLVSWFNTSGIAR
jgi:hypothetical protein